ncbi:uncharacterized protein LOC124448436 isoform X1 [Xenia sp. Carnegie-2017]|uniref:uncharacterized protein LOC124448436 isoform X1 n=1 Tax=Xenia sp. Carnegie-2017 TaxID=2897299 RepID=UPI001F03EDE2|nr:uncharacterized protein LOC124448436 isoform X1 [Xenia sp. Carnegie-2017]
MMLKIIFFFLAITIPLASAGWCTIASNLCVKPKNSQFKEFTFSGSSTFIIALRLTHVSGKIGCFYKANTNWGCFLPGILGKTTINMIITDTRNKRIFPHQLLSRQLLVTGMNYKDTQRTRRFLRLLRQAVNGCIEGKNSEFGTEKIWQAIQKATIVDKLVWTRKFTLDDI